MNTRIRMIVATLAASALLAGLLVAARTQDDTRANAASADMAAMSHTGGPDPVSDAAVVAHKPLSPEALAFHDGMRRLWEDHITWTRLFIVSAAAGLPDTAATASRLLQNQQDIGDAIKPFYGDAAGTKLTALLREHILIAGEILEAAKAGDGPASDSAVERWYANASEIAIFLSSANADNWPAPEMEAMMREHLDLTLEEAVAHLQGDYPADVAAYDKVHSAILDMSDMLSAGIIAQFPRQFR